MQSKLKKYRWTFVFAYLSILISSVFQIAFDFLSGGVLEYALSGDKKLIFTALLAMLACIGLKPVFHTMYIITFAKGESKIIRDLRKDLFSSMILRPFGVFRKKDIGEYTSFYTDQLEGIKNTTMRAYFGMGQIVTETFLVLVVLFYLNMSLALVAIGLMILPILFPIFIRGFIKKARGEYMGALQTHMSNFQDWLGGFEVIKNFGAFSHFREKARADMDVLEKSYTKVPRINGLNMVVSNALSYFTSLGVVLYAGWLVLQQEMGPGTFIVASSLIQQLNNQVPYISSYVSIAIQGKFIFQKLANLMAFEDPFAQIEKTPLEDETIHAVTYKDVTFAYEEGKPVWEHLTGSFTKPGVYLIRGESGSGKTTAMEMLLRYEKPQEGRIEINGTPVAEISNLLDKVAIMGQHPTFFDDTLRENLLLGWEADDETIMEKMRQVGLHKYATKENLDRDMVNVESLFSGGEKRRLAMVRLLLRNHPIYILDEPMANLDRENREAMERLIFSLENKMIFLITHQISDDFPMDRVQGVWEF